MSSIETVKGSISPEELGITLAHEHVIIDVSIYHRALIRYPLKPSELKLRDKPVGPSMQVLLDKNPLLVLDNLRLSDVDLAAEELLAFKRLGGGSIVDTTPAGLGRDVNAVRTVSNLTGLNIIVATGWYIAPSHPVEVRRGTVEELADIMIKELTEGIGDTLARAGIIKCAVGGITGEASEPIEKRRLHPDEKKVLRAAAIAQRRTGACMTMHPCVFKRDCQFYLDIIEHEGANLSKFCMAHMDNFYPAIDVGCCKSILDRGASISFDTFGHNSDIGYFGEPSKVSDKTRIETLHEFCESGYDRQILIGHDIGTKHRLTRYNGFGYGHILREIVPKLKETGIRDKSIRRILVDNPKRLLAH